MHSKLTAFLILLILALFHFSCVNSNHKTIDEITEAYTDGDSVLNYELTRDYITFCWPNEDHFHKYTAQLVIQNDNDVLVHDMPGVILFQDDSYTFNFPRLSVSNLDSLSIALFLNPEEHYRLGYYNSRWTIISQPDRYFKMDSTTFKRLRKFPSDIRLIEIDAFWGCYTLKCNDSLSID